MHYKFFCLVLVTLLCIFSWAAAAGNITVSTDKSTYQSKEMVKIIVENNLNTSIDILDLQQLEGSFAKLKRFVNISGILWGAVGLPMDEGEVSGKTLKPGGNHTYYWNQDIGKQGTGEAHPGHYFVEIEYSLNHEQWTKDSAKSGEFTILQPNKEVSIEEGCEKNGRRDIGFMVSGALVIVAALLFFAASKT